MRTTRIRCDHCHAEQTEQLWRCPFREAHRLCSLCRAACEATVGALVTMGPARRWEARRKTG